MSEQEVLRLQDLLARVQRNAAQPRAASGTFSAPTPSFSASSSASASSPVAASSSSPGSAPSSPAASAPTFELPEPIYAAPAYEVPSETLDPALDEMLLPDPFPSVLPPAPGPDANQQSLTDMLDEEASPRVSVGAEPRIVGEDISAVMNRSELQDEAPEELLEDDIVEMSPAAAAVAPNVGRGLDDLDFDDEEGDRPTSPEEAPASSSRSRVAATFDEALEQGAELSLEGDREVPLKTPPPESGPQAAAPLHAPLSPDIEELLEADIVPVGGVSASLPTPEQLGQTIDLGDARGPHLELDSAHPAAAAVSEEQPSEELEISLPQREFGGGYQDDLMPPPEARQDLEAHRERFGEEPAPESLAQYPSSQRADITGGAFAPVVVPQSVTTDSFTESVPMVTIEAPPNAEFAPELVARPDVKPTPVAKFIRADAPRPNTFLELLDASMALGDD